MSESLPGVAGLSAQQETTALYALVGRHQLELSVLTREYQEKLEQWAAKEADYEKKLKELKKENSKLTRELSQMQKKAGATDTQPSSVTSYSRDDARSQPAKAEAEEVKGKHAKNGKQRGKADGVIEKPEMAEVASEGRAASDVVKRGKGNGRGRGGKARGSPARADGNSWGRKKDEQPAPPVAKEGSKEKAPPVAAAQPKSNGKSPAGGKEATNAAGSPAAPTKGDTGKKSATKVKASPVRGGSAVAPSNKEPASGKEKIAGAPAVASKAQGAAKKKGTASSPTAPAKAAKKKAVQGGGEGHAEPEM